MHHSRRPSKLLTHVCVAATEKLIRSKVRAFSREIIKQQPSFIGQTPGQSG